MVDNSSIKKQIRERALNIVASGIPEKIHELSRRTNDLVVLRAIAKNEMTAPLTLNYLSVQNNKSVRKKICENKNTPYKTLVMLGKLGYTVSDEVLFHAARIELSLRKGIDPGLIPGNMLVELLRTEAF